MPKEAGKMKRALGQSPVDSNNHNGDKIEILES